MFCLMFLGLLATSRAAPQTRITNGQEAEVGIHKHAVSLQILGTHICGGSIIGPNTVSTAAHCLTQLPPLVVPLLRVVAGVHDLTNPDQWAQTRTIPSYVIHPDFIDIALLGEPNDIALLFLSAPLTMNERVGIVQLAEPTDNFQNTTCRIIGWGKTEYTNLLPSPVLREANITHITTEECIERFESTVITDKHSCVFDEGSGIAACNADSGSALMCGSNLDVYTGITSFGEASCSGDSPSVYTKVSKYRDWIDLYQPF